MTTSIGRFDNWTQESEIALNKQINLEYMASYQYHALYAYFDRDNVSMKNIANYFYKACQEEREHADTFAKYQVMRGGKVILENVSKPIHEFNNDNTKNDVIVGFELALQLEQQVYKNLLDLHKIADNSQDFQFSDYIESNFLEEQVKANYELGCIIGKLRRIGNDGHGLWNFDNTFNNN